MNMKMSVVLAAALSGMSVQAAELGLGAVIAAALFGGARQQSGPAVGAEAERAVESRTVRGERRAAQPSSPSSRIAKLTGWQNDARKNADLEVNKYQREIDDLLAAKRDEERVKAATLSKESDKRELEYLLKLLTNATAAQRARVKNLLAPEDRDDAQDSKDSDDSKRAATTRVRNASSAPSAASSAPSAASLSVAAATVVAAPAALSVSSIPARPASPAPATSVNASHEADPSAASVSEKVGMFEAQKQ